MDEMRSDDSPQRPIGQGRAVVLKPDGNAGQKAHRDGKRDEQQRGAAKAPRCIHSQTRRPIHSVVLLFLDLGDSATTLGRGPKSGKSQNDRRADRVECAATTARRRRRPHIEVASGGGIWNRHRLSGLWACCGHGRRGKGLACRLATRIDRSRPHIRQCAFAGPCQLCLQLLLLLTIAREPKKIPPADFPPLVFDIVFENDE